MNDELRRINGRLLRTLRSAAVHFELGEDQAGLDDLHGVYDDLESAAGFCRERNGELPEPAGMLPALQTVLSCIDHRDIAGLTDALESAVYPLAEKWIEGCGEQ